MIPRAEWPRGPWDGEPDLVYLQADVPCVILRGPLGALCGYVGVSSGHPWYGVSPQDLYTIKVHGGIDFGSFDLFSAPGIRVPDVPQGLYWVGFSTSHAGDLTPATSRDGEYRDLAYVRLECGLLVAQAALTSASRSCDGEHGCSGSRVDPADGLQKFCAACPLTRHGRTHSPAKDSGTAALDDFGRRVVVVRSLHGGRCYCPVCVALDVTPAQLEHAESNCSSDQRAAVRARLGFP